MGRTINFLLNCTLVLIGTLPAKAQSYHAINGSPYAGATAMYTNPASTVNSAYKWDVTLFSIQATISNNAFVINNSSLLNPNPSGFFINNGLQQRHFNTNADANLLNARFAIDDKSAVALGFRLRTYNQGQSLPFNYNDTITTLQSFLHSNNAVNYLSGSLTSAAWAEVNFNYSRVIFQTESSSLSAGITLSYLRGLSGAYASISRAHYIEKQKNGASYYIFDQGGVAAMYSDTYLITGNSNSQSVSSFLKKALPSLGLDIGAEYLIKPENDKNDNPAAGADYGWKIGVSIMDIGRNKFNPIDGSFTANGPNNNLTDTGVINKLGAVQNIRDLRDTSRALFNTLNALQNKFTIPRPARLIISLDRNLGSNFFVNAECSFNFYSAKAERGISTTEINLFTVTPRWETSAWGFYLPVQYNNLGQLWAGAAIKLGPLLVGVHDLDFFKWLKTGTQTYNGGGYILLSVHPFIHKERHVDVDDCPKP